MKRKIFNSFIGLVLVLLSHTAFAEKHYYKLPTEAGFSFLGIMLRPTYGTITKKMDEDFSYYDVFRQRAYGFGATFCFKLHNNISVKTDYNLSRNKETENTTSGQYHKEHFVNNINLEIICANYKPYKKFLNIGPAIGLYWQKEEYSYFLTGAVDGTELSLMSIAAENTYFTLGLNSSYIIPGLCRKEYLTLAYKYLPSNSGQILFSSFKIFSYYKVESLKHGGEIFSTYLIFKYYKQTNGTSYYLGIDFGSEI